MTVLVVHPGASWSTADVEAGLVYGLQQQGVRVIKFALDGRIMGAQRWLFNAWRIKKRTQPDIPRPTQADILYQAGMGALERALRHQVDAVIIVSDMYLHPDVVVLMRRAGLLVTDRGAISLAWFGDHRCDLLPIRAHYALKSIKIIEGKGDDELTPRLRDA